MNNILSKCICVLFLILNFTTPSALAQNINENHNSTIHLDDETDIKKAVENFLLALGNDDQEKLRTMFLPNANIGSISTSDGKSNIFTISVDEYLSQREAKQNRKFHEPVRQYTVNISQGMLAFVRADATVYYNGKASHHTNDFFVLMKENNIWKILSGSYTKLPLE